MCNMLVIDNRQLDQQQTAFSKITNKYRRRFYLSNIRRRPFISKKHNITIDIVFDVYRHRHM